MMTYCDRKTGGIHFGSWMPRGSILIAQHENADLLYRRVAELASAGSMYRDGTKVNEGLYVPWFSTVKYPDEINDFVDLFAKKVRAQLQLQ